MRKLSLIFIFIIIGCTEQTNWRDKPFSEMDANNIIVSEQKKLCEIKPDSIFCKKFIAIGDIKPTQEYAISILKEMNSNFKYKSDNTWHYNDNIYEYLKGDCEDIASTMAKHMIEDGIDPKYLHLVFRKIENEQDHIFLAVDTEDAGLLHLDYINSGYPIEPRINFHMRMDNPGVYKWVKGNIR